MAVYIVVTDTCAILVKCHSLQIEPHDTLADRHKSGYTNVCLCCHFVP